MSSSPSRPQTGRTTPKRTPLAERTQSQANEISSRFSRPNSRSNIKSDAERNVFTTSPFPTKPAHVLLPSTLRKQKSSQNLVADLFASAGSGLISLTESTDPQWARRRPQMKLKRSVKTLRDMYEAQADELSRPGTALSAGQRSSRPGTSNSRVRSASSSDGLSGRFAWEHFKSVAADDLALLPSLPEFAPTLKQIGSQSSFAARAAKHAATSSPNFRIHGVTSSPKMPIYKDLSELSSDDASEVPTTEPSTTEEGESSPNIVKLGRTSSVEHLPPLDEVESSPNFVKFDTSSPARTVKGVRPSSLPPRPTSSSSTSSRKRKRSAGDGGRSFAARACATNPFPSSPPHERSSESTEALSSPTPAGIRSSPPISGSLAASSLNDSSPVVRVLNQDSSSSDQLPMIETHTNLQAVLSSEPAPSSSPAAPIQYPVVHAPTSAQMAGLMIPKRKQRSSQITDSLGPKWPSRLSGNGSDTSVNRPRSESKTISKRSSFVSEGEGFDLEALPVAAYMMSESANSSQIRIIPDSERHEGEDEVAALPGDGYGYRSPPMGPIRGNSYLSGSGSSQSRLNSLQSSFDNRIRSMTSLAHSRQDSMRSYRPDSSSSMVSAYVVPTWARRYYSGFYPDSFQYLAHSTSNVNLAVTQIQPATQPQRAESLATSRSSRPSFQSIRRSISDRITSIVKNRPRLEARKSHIMPGVGPLVSNPIRGPATAALQSQNAAQHFDPRATIRPVSFPLLPADPRSQWNGVAEDLADPHHHRQSYPPQAYIRQTSGSTLSNDPSQPSVIHHVHRNRLGQIPDMSPHLHHDHRLNTGSTASRGFGYPFNRKSNRWSAPSIYDAPAQSSGNTLRNAQVICFLAGFAIPLTWFLGALLPLPARPDSFGDIEKNQWQRQRCEVTDWDEMDVIARLRAEKMAKGREEVSWQNARWWRTLNRYMCVVGVLVLILVIVLAVVGTKNW